VALRLGKRRRRRRLLRSSVASSEETTGSKLVLEERGAEVERGLGLRCTRARMALARRSRGGGAMRERCLRE
jgi:hypothetical protein